MRPKKYFPIRASVMPTISTATPVSIRRWVLGLPVPVLEMVLERLGKKELGRLSRVSSGLDERVAGTA